MNTEILSKEDLKKAVDALKRGELVIFPTETVYGVGADLFNEEAVRSIFQVKKRPSDNPLIAHIGSLGGLENLTSTLSDKLFILAEAFWPGPLSIVLPKKNEVPGIVSGNQETVAVRMPSHPVALRLLSEFKGPLVAPSANLSGRPSPTTLESALEDLNGKVPFAIEGGSSDFGIESTVLSLLEPTPVILRPGSISKKRLEEVLKEKVEFVKKDGPTLSPGMKYRHYAPRAKIRLYYDLKEIEGDFFEPDAKSFYESLRRADRLGKEEIQIFVSAKVKEDEGLMNRLLRAAGEIS